ncbi:unnamed protein product [Echinostoma caproni]|uniref:Telomere_reg-2 domain-containing protein n=1 Tax=Echinostoma caproni TaxID=27848 RepID=A0A183AR13_9TREM|nr:unnamed protein product [Echinostoma caproni]
MGMVVGERVMECFPFETKLNDDCHLKFDYEETDLVQSIKMSFVPVQPFGCDEDSPIAPTSRDTPPPVASTAQSTDQVLDSDDDAEAEDGVMNLLPQLKSTNLGVNSVSFGTRKPRYLRECLDGMLLSKPEDHHIRLMCFSVVADLIREHPTAAKELVVDIASALLHSQPATFSDESTILESQHAGLVALGVVAPKDCSRYLINEFTQITCSFGQRQRILMALTDIACELSNVRVISEALEKVRPSVEVNTHSLPAQESGPKTRRFCSKRPPEEQRVNTFISVAGDFFFPLLNSVSQLYSASQKGCFAHQDSAILTQLIATLGTIYACAHSSPIQGRMAREYLYLLPMIYCHLEPTVRQASLIALGTVVTTTPSAILSTEPTFFLEDSTPTGTGSFNLIGWLKRCLARDTDNECRALASSTLTALIERTCEAISS